jgi:hypothetical protein
VRGISRSGLKRLGKTGPDTAPATVRRSFTHKASGETVMLPEGVGFGWDYMPGDLWERGLVPSALDGAGTPAPDLRRQRILIDQPDPVADLVARARPFAAQPLEDGLASEDYVMGFLRPFGATVDRAVLWTDPAGVRIPISAEYFRDPNGAWKVEKRGRSLLTPLMAEALREPDEIWMGLVLVGGVPAVDRRYIRVDPDTGLIIVLEMGRLWWEPVTIYPVTGNDGRLNLRGLDLRRGGRLVWKR